MILPGTPTTTNSTLGKPTGGLLTKIPDKPLPDFLDVFDKLTIQLIGLTGAGKTTQIGELAKYIKFKTGKKSRLICIDRGGHVSIDHLIGEVIEPVYFKGCGFDPFVFADRTAHGFILKGGKWVDGKKDEIGLWAFDSGTGIGEEMGEAMKESQNTASPIGPKAYNFAIGEGEDTVNVGTIDKGHFGIVQQRITKAMWDSFNLPGHIVLWTAALRRIDQDDETRAPLLGAELFGKALLGASPRWFNYTWVQVKEIPIGGGAAKFNLHLEGYLEKSMGMTPVVGNNRVPLDGAEGAPVPAVIEPASVVKALALLARRKLSAKESVAKADPQAEIRKMLGL